MERLNRLWVVVAVLVVAFMAYSVGGWLNNVQQAMTTVDDLMVRMTQLEAQQAEISAALAGSGDLASGWDDQSTAAGEQPAAGEEPNSPSTAEPVQPAEPQAGAAQTATVTTQYLNVRAEPTQDSTRVGTLARGSTVQVLEEQNGWVRVRYQANGRTYEGWVDARYLQR
ncbi:SH3 type 3 domain protein [Thermaerobacter marianensis DSM 12885]|uniref:SH3 type 3 domain protein n=1 Tax=Thermaerobacter marianensis (strain ATCC 700841 / DSM 12885 / JCM 10246 / 7p75a) TaxID=644966 RepID=E6SMK9_THEM7|nr:SH3 domain-containing protein [Thermaerobacter marianensis]ADU51501.1 SH3 type 3 domain protein [Thermaerobacter marianensis DSM 12885]